MRGIPLARLPFLPPISPDPWLRRSKSQISPGATLVPECFIPLCFPLLLTPNTPKFFRRASRAEKLHFPLFSLLLDTKYPKNFPARFARRIASFPFVFLAFGAQLASSGRARAGLGPPTSPGDIVRLPEGGVPPRQTPPPSPCETGRSAPSPPPPPSPQ